MAPMTATLLAGTEVTLIGATRRGARRYRAIVADILADRIVLDAGYDEVLPTSGSAASFLHDGRLYDCDVVRSTESTLTVSRPQGLAVDDQRISRRIVTSLPATIRRSELRGDVQAAQVIDLSLGGARLLTEVNDFVVDDELDLLLGAIATRAWVRHVQPYHHDRLCTIGVEFAPLADRDRRHLLDTVGSLRAGMHRWR
jgi:hypothetical protein